LRRLAEFHYLNFDSFGNNIKIFKLTIAEPKEGGPNPDQEPRLRTDP
jgi:hypothetical protein